MLEVFDCRTDLDRNVVVCPELRGRFLRLDPLPAAPLHSHDLAGEVFLVLDGQCEFLVEEERVTCGPGQLIYVDRGVRHSLRAAGPGSCVLYLSVTPHVEPTHTFYDDAGDRTPIRYDAWRGHRHPDGSADTGLPAADPSFASGDLARRYLCALQDLTQLAERATREAADQRAELNAATAVGDSERAHQSIDAMWYPLRDLLERVRQVELAWNELAPQAMAYGG